MPLLLAEQRTPEWFEIRKNKITSSTAAAILSVDPWHGPFWAYQEIKGNHKHGNSSLPQQYGNNHEPVARRDYELETGNLVLETGFWVHPDLPWLGASPDGLVAEDGLVEIKCLGHLPPAIPAWTMVQIAVQLAVTNRQWCDYYCWQPEGYFLKRQDRDLTFEKGLLDLLAWFYHTHIYPSFPPPLRRKKNATEQHSPAAGSSPADRQGDEGRTRSGKE